MATGSTTVKGLPLAPTSMVRRRASDPRAGLGAAGYALTLQVSHPTIAAGVRDHSVYSADPWGRFFRTADFVILLAYGDAPTVRQLVSNLRRQHAAIRGTDLDGSRYSALEPSAYAWVHATLGIAIVHAHDAMGTTFTPAEREQFWQEWLVLGDALQVRRDRLPEHWDGVDDYLGQMIDEVLVDNDVMQEVQRTADRLTGSPPVGWIPPSVWRTASRPAGPLLRVLGTGLVPVELRERLRMRWSTGDEQFFRAWCRASKSAGPVLPRFVRQSARSTIKLRRNEMGPFGVSNRRARLARAS